MRLKEFYTTDLFKDPILETMADVVQYECNLSKRLKNYMKDLSRREVLK